MADQMLRLVARAEPEDVVSIEHERHFGCAQCFVWALVVEPALVVAGLLCWRLRVLPWYPGTPNSGFTSPPGLSLPLGRDGGDPVFLALSFRDHSKREEIGNMAKPLTIGTRTFDTKAAARKSIREVPYRHPLQTPIDGPDHAFLLDLLSKHPRAVEKIGVGVKHFTVEKVQGGTQCFYITRIDDSRLDFSFENCLKG
jgi:hypothetical protein